MVELELGSCVREGKAQKGANEVYHVPYHYICERGQLNVDYMEVSSLDQQLC